MLFEFCEEVFNKMSGFIELFIVVALNFTIGFRGDDSLDTFLFKFIENPFISIKSLIRQQCFSLEIFQQNIGSFQV